MKELNIEVLDADGNMKELPDLIGHIASKMEGMTDAQKTQTAAQLVGTQAASGFLALLDEGETSLANYVTELENSAGAAEEMANIQADTLNGAFEEFKSVLAEAGIQLGQEFLPEFRRIVDYGSDVVRTMSEVDTGTVKAGIAFAGTASAIAFTASTIGKLGLAIGPLLASIGPAGWLIIGASVLGGSIAALNVKMKESRKVNLELQESLTEQADTLESNVEEFDKLRGKSKATNDEFARMIDIQEELSQTQDPRRVEALQKEYEELQKKSGLSNDETVKMIDLNNEIINQTPMVESSFTDRGNSVIDATDAVKEYVQSLREMAFEELKIQQDAAFEERQRLLEENRDTTDEIAWINSNLNTIYENQDMSLGEIENRLEEINRKTNQGMLTTEEYIELEQEQSALLAIQNGLHGEALKKARNEKRNYKALSIQIILNYNNSMR